MRLFPQKRDFLNLAEYYNLIPIYEEIPCDLDTPISLFYKLAEENYCFLLESVEGAEKWAKYSFIGIDPFLIFQSKDKKVKIFRKKTEKGYVKTEVLSENPFEDLRKILKNFTPFLDKNLPRFFGGAVGFVSYESVRFLEKIEVGRDLLNFSDLHFMFPEVVLVHDRFSQSLKIIYNVWLKDLMHTKENLERIYSRATQKIQTLKEKILKQIPYKPSKLGKTKNPRFEIEKEEFFGMVKKAKKYIEKGDIIQVVLSQRMFVESDFPPFLIYRALRKVNPSPYLFFLKLDDEILIGSSPEVLVRMEGRTVETRPIAGTRRRGKDEEEDKRLEDDLKRDEKELAEHIMLVDLGRNDLGKICEFGSVEVYELMVIERYSHVMHLVSGVRGRAKEVVDMFDVFTATFPAGTVSGAPKIRAMEIITELEKKVRGPYAGAVGYFGFSGNMDFCITIRTIFKKGDKFYIQAGAGIVADSDPEREYEETLNKAKAMFKAFEIAKDLSI